MYHKSLGNSNIVKLNSNATTNAGTGSFNGTTPTNSVFTVGSDNSTRGANGNVMIAYCFTDVQGYSKFGSYTGNSGNNADATEKVIELSPPSAMVRSLFAALIAAVVLASLLSGSSIAPRSSMLRLERSLPVE